ncbi:pentatricopeptide repeat-containing protein At5g15280, mitochondrial [Oryza brachyantha]|uniref:pentatricopeptide repeat-containing protein At5g15280, mitochondrial n=1 Tax=Oryza brachyantha TaxID=4533 RepID=UPI000776644A|nr:pentatricopeptide repeat-containing protein At5g15280, mitochondrial [Oryza brachyantha]XP_015690920.1 pentatricopeptide repeat-containing protein At5g15280, mitochondrial [Oryza brachyantha]XP_015690921.1 pentatricopeptide repeat-containing protein At5g15280, mitochondrial [Oryza brachyantha]XP_015690922.1 pentatricopeptide repeat-containing protein At5g15280, mitochondrial [Oryza brachyantha]XP_040377771.1 pentatricopeptide repeat-containing protein At5g15280, mitochondrial [Oryza brachyan
MWKAWRLCSTVNLRRHPRREPKIRCQGYANSVSELNSNARSLLKDEICYTGEKKESISLSSSNIVVSSQCIGLSLDQKTGEKCLANSHSDIKLCTGIVKLVIDKCSYIFHSKGGITFDGNCILQDVLKLGFWLSPETLRPFWRASELKPDDFFNILIGFGPDAAEVKKARFLWKLYQWASWQSKAFQHLPRSNEIMVSILADSQMLSQAESLLLLLDDNRALVDSNILFSQVIQAYAEVGNLGKSMSLYDCARHKCLIPSASCYQVLLHLLMERRKNELVLRVYLDMLGVGLGSYTEGTILDVVVKALIKKDKFLQAISIIRQLKGLDFQLSKVSLSAVTEEFCKKKDIGDMVNFLEEWRYLPDLPLCNRIIASLCANTGTDEAWLVFQKLETLGFVPDATTFGIFICHSCRELKLKAAFLYLSECFARHINPKACSYNAIIGGIFREGLYRHAKYVFEDMAERKIIPELLTYKVLLAGYCRYRQFDEIEQTLRAMETNGVNDIPSGNCVLSRALSFLGLDHLGVKVKRDNAAGYPKAEFFDSVGNGLYLDTDSRKFEASLLQIIDNAHHPDIGLNLVRACQQGDIASALVLKDETFQWGHDISPASYSELLKALCMSPAHLVDAINLIEEMADTPDKFGAENLNLVVQTLSRNGRSAHARLVLDRLFRGGLPVSHDTYTYLMIGFCTERNIAGFWECWNLATMHGWSPGSRDVTPLISHLGKWGVIEEALEFISTLLDCYPSLFFSAYCQLLEELCMTGCTNIGCAMLEALIEKGVVVDPSLICNVMEGFLKEHKTAESIGMYDMLLNRNNVLDVSTYQFALSSVARIDSERVMDLVRSMMNMESTDFSTCISTMKKLVQSGKIGQVMPVFEELILGKKFSATLLNSFLQAYCCLNNWRKAASVLCMMLKTHSNISISSYRFLVRRMCEQSRISSAFRLKELIQGRDKSTGLILYNILIFYLFRGRHILQVHNLLKDMKSNGFPLDTTTYDFLVNGFHKSGDVDHSTNMLDACIAQGLMPSNRSLRVVLSHHCKLGNLEKSLELFHLIESNGWKHGLVIETTLVSSLLSSGRFSEATSCLNSLSKRALIGFDIHFDVLIKEFCILGDVEMSISLLNTMLKKGKLPSEVSYNSVLYRLCMLKEFDQALDFLAEMQLSNLKPSDMSCDVLIQGLCAMGRTCDAMKILEMLTTIGSSPSYHMYRVIFDNYCRSNNLQKAATLLHGMQQAGFAPNFEMHWSVISNLSSNAKRTIGYENPILSNLIS